MEADLGIIGLSLPRQRLQNIPGSSVLSSSLHALGCSSPYCSSTFCVRKGPGKKDGNAQSSEDTDSKWGVWFSVASYWSNSSLHLCALMVSSPHPFLSLPMGTQRNGISRGSGVTQTHTRPLWLKQRAYASPLIGSWLGICHTSCLPLCWFQVK